MKPVKTEMIEQGVKFTFDDRSYCEKHYNGNEYWYNANGKLHRENDQPAVIKVDGTKKWCINGERHRDNDQPAFIRASGTMEWWVNSKRHRGNGQPATIWADGTKEWWVNGEHIRTEKPGHK